MTPTVNQSAWDAPVVCRVEVDLPAWLEQLTGHANWEVYEEEEDDSYNSFLMSLGSHNAEVTLYHNGYAVVNVDGRAVFDGSLIVNTCEQAHLIYFNAENGEPVTLH
jgi:hypothetical protein